MELIKLERREAPWHLQTLPMYLRKAPLIALLLSTWISPSLLQAVPRPLATAQQLKLKVEVEAEDSSVTASDYCNFLTEVATSDPNGLYDEKTDKVVRIGEPGLYRYDVVGGKENSPITFVDQSSALCYCGWLENAASTFNVNDCKAGDSGFAIVDAQLRSNRIFFDAATEPKELSQKDGTLEDMFHFLSVHTLAAIACLASICTSRGPEAREPVNERSPLLGNRRSPPATPTSGLQITSESIITPPPDNAARRESYQSFSTMRTQSLSPTAQPSTLSLSAYRDLNAEIPSSHILLWNPEQNEVITKAPSAIQGMNLNSSMQAQQQTTRAHFLEKATVHFSQEVAEHALSKKTGLLTVGEVRASLDKANAITAYILSLQRNISNSSTSSDKPLTRLEGIVKYTQEEEAKAEQACTRAGTQTAHLQEAAHQALQGLGYTATVALNTIAIPVAVGAFSAALISPFAMSSSILLSHLVLPSAWEGTAVAASTGVLSVIAGGVTGYHTMNALSSTRVIYWERVRNAFREASESMAQFLKARSAQQQLEEKYAETQRAWTTYYQKNLPLPTDNSDEAKAFKQEATTHLLATYPLDIEATYEETFHNFLAIHDTLYGKELMDYALPQKERDSMLASKKPLTSKEAEQIRTKGETLKDIFDNQNQSNSNNDPAAILKQVIATYTAQKTAEAKGAYTSLTNNSESPYADILGEIAEKMGQGLKHAAPLMIRPAIGAAVGAAVGAFIGFNYGEWHSLVAPINNSSILARVINDNTLSGATWGVLVGAGMGTVDTVFPRRDTISPHLDTLGSLSSGLLTWPGATSPEETIDASEQAYTSFSQAATAMVRLYEMHIAKLNLSKAIKEEEEARLLAPSSSESLSSGHGSANVEDHDRGEEE